jgi:hypothetical protein
MIHKIVKKGALDELSSIKEDLAYWLSKPPEERVAAVDKLRKQHHGNTGRIQKAVKIIKLEKD